MTYLPDTWSETAFVCLSVSGGTEHEFMTITDTVDIKVGDKDIDVINTLAGGRLVKFNPQDITEITLECYAPLVSTISSSAGTVGTGFADLFSTTTDVSDPISITNDRTRQKVRCVVLWTSDTTVGKATASTTSTSAGFRFTAINGYVTQYNEAFTDKVKKATVKIRVPAFNKSGTGNLTWESADGASLPSISAYTAT